MFPTERIIEPVKDICMCKRNRCTASQVSPPDWLAEILSGNSVGLIARLALAQRPPRSWGDKNEDDGYNNETTPDFGDEDYQV